VLSKILPREGPFQIAGFSLKDLKCRKEQNKSPRESVFVFVYFAFTTLSVY